MSDRPRVISPEQRAHFETPPGHDEPGSGRSDGVGPWPSWFLGPVGWMLSPELVASLKSIARERLDPRRWMWLDDCHAHLEDAGGAPTEEAGCAIPGAPIATDSAPQNSAARPSLRERLPRAEPGRFAPQREVIAPAGAQQEIWFDYVADIGDGFAAMYSVSYLMQADLAVVGRDRDGLTAAAVRRDQDGKDGKHPVQLAVVAPAATGSDDDAAARRLPRGQFLFVGGDTAYHVADRATIVSRVQAPMYWAARHLDDAGQLAAGERRIYGIPGNHDWYDDLDGFSRVFRSGRGRDDPRAAKSPLAHDRQEAARPIDLIGFRRRQHASYVGIQLPWDWQLWGLDIDQRLDERQRRYFASLAQGGTPRKLILCTPSPAIVFHRVDVSDKHEDALDALALPRFYADAPAAPAVPANPVPPGTCRLDLSGDVHHYARYAGAWDATGDDRSFQSVVSGLGGAFLHSSDTVHSERAPVALFPPAEASRRECARGTVWSTLFSGGWMRVVPILLCFGLSWVLLQEGVFAQLVDRLFAVLGIRPAVGLDAAGLAARHEALTNIWAKVTVMLPGPALLIGAFFLARHIARCHAADPARKLTLFDAFRGAPIRKALDPMSSYAGVTVLAGVGLLLMMLGPRFFEHYPHGQTSDVLVVLVILFAPTAAGVVTAWKLGAGRRRGPRIAGGLFGAFHLAVQLATIVLVSRCFLSAIPWVLGAAVLYLGANAVLAPALVKRDAPIWLIAAIWILLLAGFVVAIGYGTHHRLIDPETDADRVVVVLAPALIAMVVGCAHFGWYLAVMSRLMFHNNEVGGAAKVDRYREFIRFRVEPDRITGYVIGLDRVITPSQKGDALAPFLIDVFTIAPRPVPPPAPPPPVVP